RRIGAGLAIIAATGAAVFICLTRRAPTPAEPTRARTGPAPVASAPTVQPAQDRWLAARRKTGEAPPEVPGCLKVAVEDGEYVHSPSGIVFVYVPAGVFVMGNAEGSSRDCPEETPEHKVDLSEYFIGKYEVTNE